MYADVEPVVLCYCCALTVANGECCDTHNSARPIMGIYAAVQIDSKTFLTNATCAACGESLPGDFFKAEKYI